MSLKPLFAALLLCGACFQLAAQEPVASAASAPSASSAASAAPDVAASAAAPPVVPTAAPRLALLPVSEPQKYAVENRASGLMFLGVLGRVMNDSNEMSRSLRLYHLFNDASFKPGEALTVALREELARRGLVTEVVAETRFKENDLTAVDHAAMKFAAPAVLDVRIEEGMGLISGVTTRSFAPRFNVSAELTSADGQRSLHSFYVAWGFDAGSASADKIPAPPAQIYPSWEDAVARSADLIVGLRQAAQQIAARLAEQLASKPF